MAEKTAIIVEDASNWAKQHKLALTELGFNASIATNYAEAVGLLRREKFNLAVIDLCLTHKEELRDLNGVFLLEHLMRMDTPVIVVTAHAFPELVNEIYQDFGVFAIMDKLAFSRKNFREYAGQATTPVENASSGSSESRSIPHEKIERLVVQLMEKNPYHQRISVRDRSAVHPPRSNTTNRPPAVSVFISHSSKDVDLAGRLSMDLRSAGCEVWYDNEVIHVGDTIIEMIAKGVTRCDYMIIILSPDAVASAWVRKELLMFLNEELERGRSVVLPALHKDCEMPTALKGRRFADFRSSYESGLTELSKSLGL